MPPRTRKKVPSATSKSANTPNQQESAPNPTRSTASTRATATAYKRAPSRATIPAKRVRNNNTVDDPVTNNLGNGSEEGDNPQDSQLPDAEVTPTLDNYQSLMKSWPPGRIREHLQEHKAKTHNRPSTEIRDRVKLVFKKFNQELLMLAMIGQVSEPTIKSIIPDMTATRAISPYTLFLEYCLDCLNEPMPLKGEEEGGVKLGERNSRNGARWRALSMDERAVFEPLIFYALAGVPNPLLDLENNEDNMDDDQVQKDDGGDSFVPIPTVHKLTVEEDKLYRPIYEKIVDLKKVETELGKPPTGPSNSQVQRKSKTAIEKLAHQLSCEAHRLDFAYYLVATSTVTPNKSSELGWLKQYTTHPQVATWANKTCRLATVFATYSQGESMAKAIATVNGKEKRKRPDKQQPSDKIKVDLGRLLAAITHKTLGYIPPQAFPQTADPVAELKKRALPMSIILGEGSRMTEEKLEVGFKKMKSATRLEWFNDITDGHFRLVKLKVGSDETIGEPVFLNSSDVETALTTAPRAMDKVMGLNNNNNNIDTGSQAASKGQKEKDGSASGSSDDADSDDE